VGSFLVRGDLEKAALTFLAQPSPHENPESREARQQLLDTQDFKEAARSFPKHLKYERWMLSHLAKRPRDFVGAFRRLPKKLRKLFVQAYQSFLFNKFLSQRIQRDVPLDEAQIGDYALSIDDYGLPTTQFTQVTDQSIQGVEKALTEGRTRIAVPLIGFKQPPSNGIQGEIEREIIESEGISPRDFHVSSMPEISASGGLRTTLGPIIHLSAEEASSDSVNSSKRKVKLSFTLHRGSYATILLREFMKTRDIIEAGF